jgi:hypothetical protein
MLRDTFWRLRPGARRIAPTKFPLTLAWLQTNRLAETYTPPMQVLLCLLLLRGGHVCGHVPTDRLRPRYVLTMDCVYSLQTAAAGGGRGRAQGAGGGKEAGVARSFQAGADGDGQAHGSRREDMQVKQCN